MSGEYNLIGTGGAGGLINGSGNNLVGIADPGFDGLADYGGPTQTIAFCPPAPPSMPAAPRSPSIRRAIPWPRTSAHRLPADRERQGGHRRLRDGPTIFTVDLMSDTGAIRSPTRATSSTASPKPTPRRTPPAV